MLMNCTESLNSETAQEIRNTRISKTNVHPPGMTTGNEHICGDGEMLYQKSFVRDFGGFHSF